MVNKSNQTIKVLFKWKVREELQKYLKNPFKNNENVKLVFPMDLSEENLLKLASDADIIVGWRPTKKLLNTAKKLKLYINPGAGVQHLISIFREVNQNREIILVNGHGNSYFTAQHAVAILLTLMNKVILHHNWLSNGKWRTGDDDAKSIPLRDRTVGFLGYGAVNQKVHLFLSKFSVKFAVLKRSWETIIEKKLPTPVLKYTPPELDGFLEKCDTLIIAVPQTKETKNMIKRDQLEKLGKDGLIVNMARGPVVNEEDLYTGLKEGIIKGAAIDVWYEYSPEPDNNNKKYPFHYPFYELDNIVLSPHRGASPFDDLKRWDEVITNIKKIYEGKTNYLNQVDLQKGY